MDISLFGTLQVGRDVPPSSNSRTLLAYLFLHPNQQHGRSHLAYLLNPDAPEERARRTLSQALWEARRLLPEGCITTAVDTITLHDTHLHLDLHQFDTLTTDLAHRDTLDPASATADSQSRKP